MKKIALIDDDEVHIRHYSDALETQGFSTSIASNVGEALKLNYMDFDLVVCDLMMPSDDFFQNTETNRGLMTGLRIAEFFHSDGCLVPIVLLTNLNIPNVLDDVDVEVQKMQNVLVMRKTEFNPIEFAQVALDLIEGNRVSKLPPSLGTRLANSIEIKAPVIPGFLSVDLIKLAGKKT